MKLIDLIGGIFMAMFLVGCASTGPIVNQTQIIVHQPPTTLYNCPQVRNFPTEAVVTNRDVANTIEKLYTANRTCGNNMNAIRSNIEEAVEIYEQAK